MSDPGLPPPSTCPHHPGRDATLACSRCGTFVCTECVAEAPETEPLCAPCQTRYGATALVRQGARVDVGLCLRRAWTLLSARPGPLIGGAVIAIVVQIVEQAAIFFLDFAGREIDGRNARLGLLLASLGIQIVSMWLNTSLMLGVYILWLRVLRGQPAEVMGVFDGFRRGLRGTLAIVLYLLAAVGGLILLVVPGLMMMVGLGLWWGFLVDKDMGPLASLRASWEATRGQRMNLFGLILLTGLIFIAGLLACCVGVIPAMALAYGMQAVAYTSLVYPGNRYQRFALPPPAR